MVYTCCMPDGYPTLAYAPRSRLNWRAIGLTILVLAAILLIPTPPLVFRQVESQVDGVTGSMTWKTIYPFGLTTGPKHQPSPLERRLVQMGETWTPNWHFVHQTGYDIFGRACVRACGKAPAIYSSQALLQWFASTATDDEIREFVNVMQTGSEEEQLALIDATADRIFSALAVGPATDQQEH